MMARWRANDSDKKRAPHRALFSFQVPAEPAHRRTAASLYMTDYA